MSCVSSVKGLLTRPVAEVSFFMLERARWLGVFAENEEWVFAPNKEVGFPCPAASWRCLDRDVKAAKSHYSFPFSITWAEPRSLTLKHRYNKWLKPWCELSNIEQSKSCSCQRIHSNVRTFAIPTQFFVWSVGHCFDTLTDMHRLCCHDFDFYFFFSYPPFPASLFPKQHHGDRKCSSSEGGWEKCSWGNWAHSPCTVNLITTYRTA